jgi:hypothetical protein
MGPVSCHMQVLAYHVAAYWGNWTFVPVSQWTSSRGTLAFLNGPVSLGDLHIATAGAAGYLSFFLAIFLALQGAYYMASEFPDADDGEPSDLDDQWTFDALVCTDCASFDVSMVDSVSIAIHHRHPLGLTWPAAIFSPCPFHSPLSNEAIMSLAWSGEFCWIYALCLRKKSAWSRLGEAVVHASGIPEALSRPGREYLLGDLWRALFAKCEPPAFLYLESWLRLRIHRCRGTVQLAFVRVWAALVANVGVDVAELHPLIIDVRDATLDLDSSRQRGPSLLPESGSMLARLDYVKGIRDEAVAQHALLQKVELCASNLASAWGSADHSFDAGWNAVCGVKRREGGCIDQFECVGECFTLNTRKHRRFAEGWGYASGIRTMNADGPGDGFFS